ncbi:hypothetical protein [Pseudomonas sp. N40(2020)]|nr:hypothetical protein [Pseudomonas sp. N40(2020)]
MDITMRDLSDSWPQFDTDHARIPMSDRRLDEAFAQAIIDC